MERFNCKCHSCHYFMNYGLRYVQCVCMNVRMYVCMSSGCVFAILCRLFTVLHSAGKSEEYQ